MYYKANTGKCQGKASQSFGAQDFIQEVSGYIINGK